MDGCRLAIRDLLFFKKHHSAPRHVDSLVRYLKSEDDSILDQLSEVADHINLVIQAMKESQYA